MIQFDWAYVWNWWLKPPTIKISRNNQRTIKTFCSGNGWGGLYTVHSDCPPPCSLAKPRLNKRQVHPNNIFFATFGVADIPQKCQKVTPQKRDPYSHQATFFVPPFFPRPPAAPSSGRAVKRRFCFGDARMYCRSCTWLRRCLCLGFREGCIGRQVVVIQMAMVMYICKIYCFELTKQLINRYTDILGILYK